MAKKFLTGLNLVVLDADPATGSEGELYFNSSASVAKIYQAGSWSVLGAGGGGGAITVSTTEPASPETGDAWYKNDTGEFYVYDGTYWVEVNGVIEGISQEEVQDYIAPLFTNSTNSNVISTYDDANNVINLNASGPLVSIDYITYPDYITFDTFPETSSASTGTIFWDSGDSVLKAILNENVELGIGQESVALVKNATGSTLSKGKVVYISGAAGQRPTVELASSSSEATSSKTFGFVAEELLDEAEGFVVTDGILRGLNTDGLTEGGALWLSSSGNYTQTMPTQPNHGVFLGYLVRAHPASGEIYVKIQNGYELEELHNVLISASIQNGESLVWNSASGLWMNQLVSGGGGATTTVSETAPESADLGDTWYKQSNGSFFIFDGTYWVEVTNTITMTDEQAQDKVSSLFVHSNHSNLTATYDDENNQIIMSTSASVSSEQVQDLIAPLFTHANHTNIIASYDDENNEILLSASGGYTNQEAIDAVVNSGSVVLTNSIANVDTTTISSASATTINTISSSTYRSAEILVQIVQGSKQTISKILMIHDDTTANITEYGLIELGESRIPVTISATLTGGNVLIQATITDANVTSATVKVLATLISI